MILGVSNPNLHSVQMEFVTLIIPIVKRFRVAPISIVHWCVLQVIVLILSKIALLKLINVPFLHLLFVRMESVDKTVRKFILMDARLKNHFCVLLENVSNILLNVLILDALWKILSFVIIWSVLKKCSTALLWNRVFC